MRVVIFLTALTLLPSVTAAEPAATPQAYYQGIARGAQRRLPDAATYRQVYDRVTRESFELPTDEQLARRAVAEVDLMLRAVGQTPPPGVAADLRYPAAVIVRLQGRVKPGLVWLAACHGLAQHDRDSEFFSPEEWQGLPDCGTTYTGPSQRPRPG